MLPVATYNLETTVITRKTAVQLKVIQGAMERIILSITLKDKLHNYEIRNKTKATDNYNHNYTTNSELEMAVYWTYGHTR